MVAKLKQHSDKMKHKSQAKCVTSSSSSVESEASLQVKRSSKLKLGSSEQDKQQSDPDPVLYWEVDMSDLLSQYTEDIETFRQILNLPDRRDSMPRSSTTVSALNDVTGYQELKPRGPSAMLLFSPQLKDAFVQFEHNFQATNLPEGKYIKNPASTSKWYKLGQHCFEDKLQELNTDFAKICISPKPFGAPMGKQILIQQRALACQSKALAYILQRELYTYLPVSTTLLKQSHNYVFPPHLVSRSGQLQEQGFSVEVAKNCCHQQGPSTSQSGPFLRNGAEKI